ncbi:cytochrome P450 [Acrasis kona]|uniref:Cytochrome P450 n=1 Tax=Acrasis kona TaxID=1008807 RepID=A0AAW2ZDT8_9EUKA
MSLLDIALSVAALLTFVVLMVVANIYLKYIKTTKMLAHIPGVNQFIPIDLIKPNTFLSRFFLSVDGVLFTHALEMKEKYGPVYKIAQGLVTGTIFVHDPDFGKLIAAKGGKVFKKDQLLNDGFLSLFGDHSIFTTNEEAVWRRHRSMLNPAFTDEKLQNAVVRETNKTLTELLHSINQQNVREVSEDMSNLTLDIVGRAGFGYEFGCTNKSNHANSKPLSENTKTILSNLVFFLMSPFKTVSEKYLSTFKPIKALFDSREVFIQEISNIIENRRREGAPEENDILSLLLRGSSTDKDGTMVDRELINNCLVMIIAGHETTSHALTFSLYLLAKHQDIQEAVYNSIKEKIQKPQEREFTYEDYEENLIQVHHVFDEALRLYPVAVGNTRQLAMDVDFKGYRLPKHSNVTYNWYTEFMDEKNFYKPKEFIPSRWNEDSKGPSSYTPFGVGNRSCIGKKFAKIEAVLSLARILSNFKVTLRDADAKLTPVQDFTLRAGEVFLTFNKRQDF